MAPLSERMTTSATRQADRLAAANLEIRRALAGADRDRARRRLARRGIETIDVLLEAVERYHLARHPRHVPMLHEWRALLEEVGGLTIPADILDLRHTEDLHAALLDWQEELLNDAVPQRARLAQEDDERDQRQRLLCLGRPSGWHDVDVSLDPIWSGAA